MEIFSERFKIVLEKRGLSQRKFAGILGVEQTTVNSYCTGNCVPSVAMLLRISELLDVSTDYLLGRAGNFE